MVLSFGWFWFAFVVAAVLFGFSGLVGGLGLGFSFALPFKEYAFCLIIPLYIYR